MKTADLHLHTYFSDSTYSPEALVKKAGGVNLSCISVVDHDSVGGILPTINEAKKHDIEVLPGIELSCEYNNIEVHILGYLIDYSDKELIAKTEFLKHNRIERVYKILAKLKSINNIDLNPKEVFALAKFGTVGRLHIARALVKENLVGSLAEVFNKLIGDNCPANVLGFRFSVPQAVRLIKDIGGIPVLAHPYSLKDDSLVLKFIEDGVMGLEVYYPEQTKAMQEKYLALAKRFNLLVTGGSDCHDEAKPEIKIGSVKIPYELVEKLKEAKSRLPGCH